jgi:hypothetical protein
LGADFVGQFVDHSFGNPWPHVRVLLSDAVGGVLYDLATPAVEYVNAGRVLVIMDASFRFQSGTIVLT